MTNDKAILVVSFGTSYNDNRAKTIGAIEGRIADDFPDWDVRRAFTSKMIIAKLAKRDGEKIDYITDAMQRLVDDGYRQVVVQPTHIMNGEEYDDVVRIASGFADRFDRFSIGTPLLTREEDYDEVMDLIEATMVKDAEQFGDDTAVVLMGHGSEHYANATYSQLQLKMMIAGLDVYVTTVEGYPTFDDTVELMDDLGYKHVVLYPFMVVAGDHANNDMAGDEEDSLKNVMEKAGYKVHCVVEGLGSNTRFQRMFVEHTREAVEKLNQ